MAAIKSAIDPQMMERLKEKQRFINDAAKAVNPFAKFPGPDGNYYALLSRIVWSVDTKTQCIVVRAVFVIVAYVEDGNTDYAAYPVRIQFYLRDSAKSTEKDAWDRLYINLFQALNCVTAKWEQLRDQAGQKIPVIETMAAETDRLNAERPAVVLSITANPSDIRYQNINIRETLIPEALSAFTRPNLELSDDQINEDLIQDESEVEDFTPNVEAAKAMLLPLDAAGCIEQGKASQLDLDFDTLTSMPVRTVRHAILVSYIEKAGFDPSTFDLKFGDEEEVSPEISTVREVDRIKDSSDSLEEALEEALEESIEEGPSIEEQIDSLVSKLSRKERQLRIRGLDAASKFFATQSDDELGLWLKDLLMKSEVPFTV